MHRFEKRITAAGAICALWLSAAGAAPAQEPEPAAQESAVEAPRLAEEREALEKVVDVRAEGNDASAKAQEKIDLEKALELEKKLRKDNLTLEDFLTQMREMRKLGSLGDILKLLPGAHKIDSKMTEQGEKDMKRVEAIILSMTVEERRKPQLLNASRKRRIALGSGTEVQNVNKLLRDFEQVRIMAKRMKGPKKKVPFAPQGMRGRGGFRFGG